MVQMEVKEEEAGSDQLVAYARKIYSFVRQRAREKLPLSRAAASGCDSLLSRVATSLAGVYSASLAAREGSSLTNDDGKDHSVQANSLSENEDEDHTDEDSVSLGVGSHSSVTSDSDGQPRGEGAQSASKSSSEDLVSSSAVSLLGLGLEEDSHDNTVDTQDTSHDNWDDGSEDLA